MTLDKSFIYKISKFSSPLGQRCVLFILLGFNDNKVLRKYFKIFVFCSEGAFQRYIDIDNPTVDTDTVSENVFTASDFLSDLLSL